jgi:hypothetical protein
MVNKITLWGASLSVALVGAWTGSAADPMPVGNTTQKGSLLIFPRVDVSPGRTTIIRITNDTSEGVDVKCYFMDVEKNKVDFQFGLTEHQPFWFDVASGEGTRTVRSFPTSAGHYTGELKCWAVSGDGTRQISWNHLVGNATVFDFENSSAYEYNAWAFQAMPPHGETVGSQQGRLNLNGEDYDFCPRRLIGNFAPVGRFAEYGEDGDSVFYEDTELTVASCKQDLRQDFDWRATKLAFGVWNEDGAKFTGAYECADSWHETLLSEVETVGQNFLFDFLKTDSAYYRVEGIKSTACDNVVHPGTLAKNTGLTGVQVTLLELNSATGTRGFARTGTTLQGVGTRPGFILWGPSDEPDDE